MALALGPLGLSARRTDLLAVLFGASAARPLAGTFAAGAFVPRDGEAVRITVLATLATMVLWPRWCGAIRPSRPDIPRAACARASARLQPQRERKQHRGMSGRDGRIAPHQREPSTMVASVASTVMRTASPTDRHKGTGERSGERHQRLGRAEQHRQQGGATCAQPERPERQRHRDVVQAEHEFQAAWLPHDLIP